MAKRKKTKPNVKQQQAQHRKAYLRKLIATAELIGVEDFRLLVTPEMLDSLYNMRIRVTMTASDTIPASVRKAARARQDESFGAYTVALNEEGAEVSIRDYLTIGQSLYFFVNSEHDAHSKQLLKEKFARYINYASEEGSPYLRLNEILWFVTVPFCDLSSHLYWMTHTFKLEGVRLTDEFELHTVRPERKRVCLDGVVRTVFRMGWAMPEAGPQWVDIDRGLFDDTVEHGQATVPVFVQSHALHRMSERLDCTDSYLQQFYMFVSLREPKVVPAPNGGWLIEYGFKGYKLGYLLADMIDEVLVIRTFLFITMDSTPEGKALQEAIGLEAVDKKYLAIDRLSTFLVSDIINHPDIKAHFIQAGCEDLFGFDTSSMDDDSRLEVAEFIRSYLDTSRSDREMMPGVAESFYLQEAAV